MYVQFQVSIPRKGQCLFKIDFLLDNTMYPKVEPLNPKPALIFQFSSWYVFDIRIMNLRTMNDQHQQ